ncbi:uncharacterized protein LOC122249325 [Penaeus japonicus]|uniref:uncharacterized protein LOC122249325 n=1 Tax=Penaeus japonicus TaxID=27405 RepID=UPI001C715CDA|nr:uncharacterized protein LOC122249325 [Penaeus japonicus]
MPQLRPVLSLKALCVDALASALACAFVTVASGGLNGPAKKLAGKSKKQGSAKKGVHIPDSILTSNPSSQVAKIQSYVGQGVPKDKRSALFHKVLLRVTNILTALKSKKSKRNPNFGETLAKLGQALGYVFDLLLDPELARLNMTPMIHQSVKWVSTCKLNNRDPKETNEIDACKVENMLTVLLGENAYKLASVVDIRWPHLVSGEIIKIIGGHCKNLRRLELACECDATAGMNDVKEDPSFARKEMDLVNSLSALYHRAPGDFSGSQPSGCPLLQTLVLPRMDDEDGSLASSIADALCSLKDLECVAGAPMLVSLDSLRSKGRGPQRLALKHLSDIDNYNRRPMPDLNHLKTMLPSLTSIELIVSQGITRSVTENFLNVTTLKIQLPDFHTSVRSFKYLDTLDINLDFQVAWPLLFTLSRGRVPVKHLTLRHPTFQVGQEHEGTSLKLHSLLSFTLVRSSFIEYTAFRTLVVGAPNLAAVSISLSDDRNYVVDEFRDDLIASVAPLMPNLESFVAECQYKHNLYHQLNCILTIASADVLVARCPRLKFLGHLDCWDVTGKEVNGLIARVRANNWALMVS